MIILDVLCFLIIMPILGFVVLTYLNHKHKERIKELDIEYIKETNKYGD